MINELKQLTHNVIDGEKLADLKFGTVESANPLTVRLNQWLLLSGSMLAVSYRLRRIEIPVTVDGKTGTAVLDNRLQAGDTVALLRQSGGQKFYVLDKVKT